MKIPHHIASGEGLTVGFKEVIHRLLTTTAKAITGRTDTKSKTVLLGTPTNTAKAVLLARKLAFEIILTRACNTTITTATSPLSKVTDYGKTVSPKVKMIHDPYES